VAVVIGEGAAGAPIFSAARNMRFFADVGERAVAVVVIENIFAVVGDIKIFEAVIVVVTDAHALSPAGVSQARFFGDIGERAVVIVVVEVARRGLARRQGFQLGAVHDKNIRPAVVVVVKNGDARSRRFNDVFFCVFTAKNYWCNEPGLLRDIGEMHDRFAVCTLGFGSVGLGRVW